MRTLGGEVVGGRSGRSLVGGSLSEAFGAYRVAVLLCCMARGSPVIWRGLNPRIKSLTGLSSPGFVEVVRHVGQLGDAYACVHAWTRANCN
jgi:hypothetical protein